MPYQGTTIATNSPVGNNIYVCGLSGGIILCSSCGAEFTGLNRHEFSEA
jgi:hypothetical protein